MSPSRGGGARRAKTHTTAQGGLGRAEPGAAWHASSSQRETWGCSPMDMDSPCPTPPHPVRPFMVGLGGAAGPHWTRAGSAKHAMLRHAKPSVTSRGGLAPAAPRQRPASAAYRLPSVAARCAAGRPALRAVRRVRSSSVTHKKGGPARGRFCVTRIHFPAVTLAGSCWAAGVTLARLAPSHPMVPAPGATRRPPPSPA